MGFHFQHGSEHGRQFYCGILHTNSYTSGIDRDGSFLGSGIVGHVDRGCFYGTTPNAISVVPAIQSDTVFVRIGQWGYGWDYVYLSTGARRRIKSCK
jgi:allantoicase